MHLAGALVAAGRSQSHTRDASVPGDKLPSSQRSRPLALPLGLDGTKHFVNLSAPVLVRQARMTEVGFIFVSALDGRIDKARTVLAQCLEECARVPAVLGASALVAGIECAVAPVWPKVRPVPQCHHPEHTCLNAHLACRPLTLEQMQFLESGEYPVREIDIDAERIKNLALKLERQSFAYQQMVVFGAPARSHRILLRGSAAVTTKRALQKERRCASKTLSSRFRRPHSGISKKSNCPVTAFNQACGWSSVSFTGPFLANTMACGFPISPTTLPIHLSRTARSVL
jgi:hypothetical protein